VDVGLCFAQELQTSQPPMDGCIAFLPAGEVGRMDILLKSSLPHAVLALWTAATELGWVRRVLLPKPIDVLEVLVQDWPILVHGFFVSFQTLAIGMSIGSSIGIGIGLAIGYSDLARKVFELPLDLVRPVPVLALIPLFVLWFGIGVMPQVLLIAVGVLLLLSLSTIEAIRHVPETYVRAARALGASRWIVYQTVIIPAIVPAMVASLRYAVAISWGLLVAAEYTGSRDGLGYQMIARQQYLDTAGILAIVFIFSALAIVSDRIIRLGLRHLTRWQGTNAK
jgi:ABC-type nitrate/sulfonate/bicarbonate transport system permease component